MNQDPVRIGQVEWTRLFPLLRLLKAVPIGCSLTVLLPAAVCIALNRLGELFLPDAPEASGQAAIPGHVLWQLLQRSADWMAPPLRTVFGTAADTFLSRQPFLFFPLLSASAVGLLLVWTTAVTGITGVAMTRSAAGLFCQNTRQSPAATAAYAARQAGSVLLAAGLAAVVILIPKSFLAAAAWLAGVGMPGRLLVELSWPIIVAAGLGLWVLFLVTAVAWGLAVAACGTDDCSGAEALSRSISYVLSHPLWTLLGLTAVLAMGQFMFLLSHTVLAAGEALIPESLSVRTMFRVHAMWDAVLQEVPATVQLSVQMAGFAILYVLLRQKEDGVPLREMDGAAPPEPARAASDA